MKHTVVLLLLIAGCGGGGGDGEPDAPEGGGRDCGCVLPDTEPITCAPDGAGVTSGKVAGVEVGPVVRANQMSIGSPGATVISIDETPGACGEPSDTGEHVVVILCGQPQIRDYPIVPSEGFTCPNDNAVVLIEAGGGADLATASSGTVTIDELFTCTGGSFAADFGADGVLTGNFSALICN